MMINFFLFQTDSFFAPENVVSVLVGTVATLGLTQWMKNAAGWHGTLATLLAFVLSFVIAIAAVLISMYLSGATISWDTIPTIALQVFGLATAAFKLMLADKN